MALAEQVLRGGAENLAQALVLEDVLHVLVILPEVVGKVHIHRLLQRLAEVLQRVIIDLDDAAKLEASILRPVLVNGRLFLHELAVAMPLRATRGDGDLGVVREMQDHPVRPGMRRRLHVVADVQEGLARRVRSRIVEDPPAVDADIVAQVLPLAEHGELGHLHGHLPDPRRLPGVVPTAREHEPVCVGVLQLRQRDLHTMHAGELSRLGSDELDDRIPLPPSQRRVGAGSERGELDGFEQPRPHDDGIPVEFGRPTDRVLADVLA